MFKNLLSLIMIAFLLCSISTSHLKLKKQNDAQCEGKLSTEWAQCGEDPKTHQDLGECCEAANLKCEDLYAGWKYCVTPLKQD